jgi:hypothetical protein
VSPTTPSGCQTQGVNGSKIKYNNKCNKVNMFLHFWNKMMLKIKEYVNASERCFLWLNWTGVHGFTCLLSPEVVVSLSAKRMTATLI